jgi:hypothetical protein
LGKPDLHVIQQSVLRQEAPHLPYFGVPSSESSKLCRTEECEQSLTRLSKQRELSNVVHNAFFRLDDLRAAFGAHLPERNGFYAGQKRTLFGTSIRELVCGKKYAEFCGVNGVVTRVLSKCWRINLSSTSAIFSIILSLKRRRTKRSRPTVQQRVRVEYNEPRPCFHQSVLAQTAGRGDFVQLACSENCFALHGF